MYFKKPTKTAIAKAFKYGGKKFNVQIFTGWEESGDRKLQNRFKALQIGYIFLKNGFDFNASMIVIERNKRMRKELQEAQTKNEMYEQKINEYVDKMEALKGIAK